MPMTIVVTRNSPERFRGFLTSCMCEIAPGVYTAPRLTQSVRDGVWSVLSGWFQGEMDHAILMTWPDATLPGGQDFRFLGSPRQELCELDGVFLARRSVEATDTPPPAGSPEPASPRALPSSNSPNGPELKVP